MTRKRKTVKKVGPRKGALSAKVYIDSYGEASVTAAGDEICLCPSWARRLFPGLKTNDSYSDTQYTITATPQRQPKAKPRTTARPRGVCPVLSADGSVARVNPRTRLVDLL